MKKFLVKLIPGFIKRRLIKRAVEKSLKQMEGTQVMGLLKAFFVSKKAAAFLSGLLALVLSELLGLDEATVEMIVELIIGYIVGQGAVDVALALKGKKDR